MLADVNLTIKMIFEKNKQVISQNQISQLGKFDNVYGTHNNRSFVKSGADILNTKYFFNLL